MLSSQLPRYSANERVLCLSNGHGEDIIAVRILQALQQDAPALKLAALPLVGEGHPYTTLGIPIIGPVKAMPSGGFIYMDGRQFARDLQSGLLQLTLAQFQTIRQWVRQGGSILAVGDIVPLLLAWLSGAPYGFVGTAKSEYYLRDEAGKLFPQARLEAWSGSIYYPWERWLMSRDRCRAVFPRDSLTTKILQKWEIPAFDLGNPMMDGLEPRAAQPLEQNELVLAGLRQRSAGDSGLDSVPAMVPLVARSLTDSGMLRVVLLPGSRLPEAYENWQLILQAVDGLISAFPAQTLTIFGAIAPTLNLEPLCYALESSGWKLTDSATSLDPAVQVFPDPRALWFTYQQATLVLSHHAYADSLHWADCAIAMAGTATEQFVGLGKPAFIIPGQGPQFTLAFAESQTRLLGESVILVDEPAQLASVVQQVFSQSEQLHRIAHNGFHRMGRAGSATRIANCLLKELGEVSKNRALNQ